MPQELLAALDAVILQHPYALNGWIAPTPRADSDAERLWLELLRLDPSRLAGRLLRLTVHQSRLVAYRVRGRLREEDVSRLLAALFAAGKGDRLGALAFDMYVLTDGTTEFRAKASDFARAAPPLMHLTDVFEAARPIVGLAAALGASGLRLSEWERVGPEIAPEVVADLIREALDPSNLEGTIAREGPDEILQWVNTRLTSVEGEDWFEDYLGVVVRGSIRDRDPILLSIVRIFGRPSTESTFWRRLPESMLRAVHEWLIEADLRLHLGDEDRVAFWKRFLPRIERAVPSTDRAAVFLVFDRWFACQFRESGVATFCLPISQLRYLQRLTAARLAQEVRGLPHLGRYEHRGFMWRIRAERTVRRVMAEVERAN